MNKIKKALLLALSLAMSATMFAACKDKNNGGGTSSSDSSSEVSTPVEDSSEESSSEESSSEESSSEESSSEESSSEESSSEESSSEESSSEESSSEESSSEESSSEESSSEESSSEESSSEDSSSEESSEEVSTPVESSSEVESESSENSSSEPEIATYTFTKIIDRRAGLVLTETLEVGAVLDLNDPDPIEGKRFTGWVDENGNSVTEGTMPEGNYTVYATFELEEYTVTIDMPDGADDVVIKFAVEDSMTNPELKPLQWLGSIVAEALPQDTKTTKYTVAGMPEDGEWELKNYELTVTAEKIDDEDLAGTIMYWDRLNKNVLNGSEQGKVKTNVANYWDGSESSVTVENQKDVTNGSDFAMKLAFNFSKLTQDELTAADAGWANWSTNSKQMWVGYAIPVGGIDLTDYDLVFDMKTENMNTTFVVYAANDYEGEGATYAVDKNITVKQANAQALENGWYRYTVTIDCSWGVGTAADYIVLSLDNTASDVDKTQDSVAYIDNVSIQKMNYYTVSVDGDENRVKEGGVFTPETPVKDGYEFLGWVDGEGNAVATPITVTGDTTLVSNWKKLPLQATLGVNNVDISETCNAEGAYEVVEFSGKAGTYNVSATGVRVFKIVDGAMSDEAVTQLVLAEDTTVSFAVTYGEDIELTGTIAIEFVYDPQIESAAVKVADSALGGTHATTPIAATEDVVAAPNGFKQATAYAIGSGWNANSNSMWAAAFDNTDLSSYDEAWFAIKAENGYVSVTGTSLSANTWVYFHLIKTAATTWTIEITVNGETTKLENQSGTEVNSTSIWVQGQNAISTILYGNAYSSTDGGYVMIMRNDATAKFYATEVMGYTKPWDPEIADGAVMVVDSVLGSGHGSDPLTKYAGTDDTTVAPAGFKNVTRYDTATPGNMWVAAWKNTDISTYAEVWFAVKTVGGTLKTAAGDKVADSWMYFHLTQTADSVWTVEITIDGAVYETQVNQSGTEVNTTSTSVQAANTISTVLYGNAFSSADGGYVMIYNTSGGTMNLYATEVMGLAKA